MILHITDAKYLKDYQLELSFNNGKKGIADLSQSLDGSVFNPLKDKKLFSQLKLNKELDTVVWPNGADFAPEYLYFQAFKYIPELQDQFRVWGYID
ncbi:conserved hypothetical protein [Desulfamplus magnetovallimortis]|uniref:DUF2442 domain-containing protein n=1 Tax=Desulfamplus magnetovallimortis TaxID=1246637 RepID=A0A1W1HEW2_9BACT|nr:DUF2442 domain-containing protein [Desulfamplus magnetovallimortis]SLM31027.1 conserved hypothetical protein [Desulfamplus magnetovallimortis]